MIEVKYHRKYHRVTIKGHAGSGEPGHDLVCASASILAYTLASSVMNAEIEKLVRDAVINLEEGNAEISCKPVNRMKAIHTLVFDSICAGFDILAQKYPNNISYDVLG